MVFCSVSFLVATLGVAFFVGRVDFFTGLLGANCFVSRLIRVEYLFYIPSYRRYSLFYGYMVIAFSILCSDGSWTFDIRRVDFSVGVLPSDCEISYFVTMVDSIFRSRPSYLEFILFICVGSFYSAALPADEVFRYMCDYGY